MGSDAVERGVVSESGWTELDAVAGLPLGRLVPVDTGSGLYLVDGEAADVFAVRRRADGAASRRHFVARLPDRAVLPGDSEGNTDGWSLLLVPLPGTEIRLIPSATMTTLSSGGALTDGVDAALLAVAGADRAEQAPRDAVVLHVGEILSLSAGQAITGNSAVCWARTAGDGLVRAGGARPRRATPIPLPGRDWATAARDCVVAGVSTRDLLRTGELAPALAAHMHALLSATAARLDALPDRFTDTIDARRRADAALVASAARTALGAVGATSTAASPRTTTEHRLALYWRAVAVLEVMTEGTGAAVAEPADRRTLPEDHVAAITAVARSSALHLRSARLPSQWWRRDLGPIIGWCRTEPSTLDTADAAAGAAQPWPLRFRRGWYHVVDPHTRQSRKLREADAAQFEPLATYVQPPLPRECGMGQAIRLGMLGAGRDFRLMVATGLAAATLGLATPLATGAVLGRIATNAGGLLGAAALLVGAAVVAGLVTVAQGLRLLQVEGRVEVGLQLVLWDRLMRLPVRFFRDTGSGQLANAVLGISYLRQTLSGQIALAITATLTMLAELILIFWINAWLGVTALATVMLIAAIGWFLGRRVLRRQRAALPAEHYATALANQVLRAITKIKLAGAEDRAYSRWTEAHARARAQVNRVREVQSVLVAVATVAPIAGQLVLFTMLAGPLSGQIRITEFFIVNTAFMLLFGAALLVMAGSVELLAALPRLEVLQPVLGADPERMPDRVDPGELRGEIEVNGVTFAYNAEEAPVLHDVSITVRAGEFVAIVGPSGCGKSTLLRLLLGFESPNSGAVLYDGQDLAELDVQAVRRQCGVVLQDGVLFAGSIRENICGAGNYPLDRLWEAARMAGLDEDIAAFPMGMGTHVSFGGGTLSVGQRQRVLIARALIDRPRILFFDEATSALDNRTQEIVTGSTKSLSASRVIIAHRLSTVMDADRIVVLDRGRVVQQGRYQQLMADRDGLFYRLARRQLLTVE